MKYLSGGRIVHGERSSFSKRYKSIAVTGVSKEKEVVKAMKKPILAVSLLVAVTISVVGWSPPAHAVDSVAAEDVNGPLDGMTFVGALGPDGEPKDVLDTFVFDNGTFVSKECELNCKYPARPYFVRVNGTKTEFISETQCPYKDAKIVWRGTVEGDTIKGKSTWVVKRWYWTVENTFEFEGKLAKQPISITSFD